jgi:CubicO group peptidase (beta-lactamase class C family)
MRLRLIGFVALLALSACGRAAKVSDAEVAARADAYLQARVDAGTFKGTVLLARGPRTLFVKGYGLANEESGARNGEATRFPTASITKTFTAALVMKLRHEGKLALEDPACRHLVPCPAHWQPVTLRQLLTHTTGIPDYARTADFRGKMHEPRSIEHLIAEFRDRPLEFSPGAKYSYSNSNYVLLGVILEKVGGKAYGDLLREKVLEPLGMRDTGVEQRVDDAQLAIGYKPHGVRDVRAEPVDPSWLYAAGAVYSTVGDLAKWTQALQTGAILSREDVTLMWSSDHGKYGFGWELLGPSPQTLDHRLVYHSGGTTGFATDLLHYPDEDVTVILLANLLPVPLADISRDLSAIVFGDRPVAPPARRAVRVDPSIYDEYVGDYQLAPNVALTVTKDGDQLAVQATGQPRDIAIPESETTFYSRISPVRVTFSRDESGRVSRLILHDGGRDLHAPRK